VFFHGLGNAGITWATATSSNFRPHHRRTFRVAQFLDRYYRRRVSGFFPAPTSPAGHPTPPHHDDPST